ncbi:katanin p60 ATPase-containing subunit A-like 2 [Notothenia coriiceps]|uniref:Katanin p60 ATPase-containing subunit A-like 2 n=1 Tax=Notothenia coriiceps TaxID=8208 RepID=A0A6I9NT04_9TELE|nr:PREDICTED: katanin p60 ATPase-containing subunit A-like 2 [Notothenia coriiceps]
MELSYQSMKVAHQAREADELRTETRRKNLLILIYHHLLGQGYVSAAVALEQETNGGVRRFLRSADNPNRSGDGAGMEYEELSLCQFQKYSQPYQKNAHRTRYTTSTKTTSCSIVINKDILN